MAWRGFEAGLGPVLRVGADGVEGKWEREKRGTGDGTGKLEFHGEEFSVPKRGEQSRSEWMRHSGRWDSASHFDFVGGGFYKCGCHRNSIHDSLAAQCWAGQVTTAIVRMFGKAVKFRYCPATVSAPYPISVGEEEARAKLRNRRILRQQRRLCSTTGVGLREGKGLLMTEKLPSETEGASQETGP